MRPQPGDDAPSPAAGEARELIQQAVASRDVETMLRGGSAALQSGLESEAVPAVETLLADHNDDARLWLLLGLLHRANEELALALEAFRRAGELDPASTQTASGLAFATLEAGLPTLDLFERACAMTPTDGALILGRAAAQLSEGREDDALDGIEQHLRLNPLWFAGHARLTRLRWRLGDRDDFGRSFEAALQQAPRGVRLWVEYVAILLGAELYERALAIIARARAAIGDRLALDAAEAVARSSLGETEAADELFGKLSQFSEITVTEHHVRHLLRSGRVREAVELAEARTPQDSGGRLWPYLSIGWRMLGDPRWRWLEGDPAFVGVYDIEDRLPPLGRLADRLRALHLSEGQPLDQSVRGGTQTDGQLFPLIDPDIRLLRKAIVQTVEEHVARLPARVAGHPLLGSARAPIRFSGSWSVRLTDGGWHCNHVHPAGWISSALYVALPDPVEDQPGDAGWLALGQASELGVDVPPIRLIEPKPGRLVLFPSTMWHGTRPFQLGERLTVAFDVKRPQ